MWVGALALAATVALVVGVGWRSAQGPDAVDDLALAAELDLVENLELLGNPDFDVLLVWNGEAP